MGVSLVWLLLTGWLSWLLEVLPFVHLFVQVLSLSSYQLIDRAQLYDCVVAFQSYKYKVYLYNISKDWFN